MENMFCKKCGSVSVRMDSKGTQIGLYCKDCGQWIKWVSKKDVEEVEQYIKLNEELLEGITVEEASKLEVIETTFVNKNKDIKNIIEGLERFLSQKEYEYEIDEEEKTKGIIIGLKIALRRIKEGV